MDVEPATAMDATDVRGSSKRTADSIGLKEGGESRHRLEKARRAVCRYQSLRVRSMILERRDRDRQDG